MTTELRNTCDLAQPFCDDVVQVAGFFTPNAPGGGGLAANDALDERGLLRLRGAYLAERVLLAVTPLEVVAIAFGPGAREHLQRVVWRRSELVAQLIPSSADGPGPHDVALGLTRKTQPPRLEVAWDATDDASQAVVDRLVGTVDA